MGEYIHIKGARVHNLKNIEVKIPHNQLVVITGLSGSGKSTLAFDTIFAEGQRRYVESLSAYARQFLGRINKPDVDFITGIAPAIAVEQKVSTKNPRSTVGTTTEIYDYLKLLYARVGRTISPISGREVKAHSVSDVVDYILSLAEDTRFMICSPIITNEGQGVIEKLTLLLAEGYDRIFSEGETLHIDDILKNFDTYGSRKLYLIIDRGTTDGTSDNVTRYGDSVQTALSQSGGECAVISQKESGEWNVEEFSDRFELDGMIFERPYEHLFSFNNPLGACPRCEGYGKVVGIDENLVIPDKTKSIYDDAIASWRGETMRAWKDQLIRTSYKFDFPIHKPYYDLSAEQKLLLWRGNEHFEGLDSFFAFLEAERYKVQYRVMLSRYSGKTICPDCGGGRLKQETTYVKVGGKSINELVMMPVADLSEFFKNLQLDDHDRDVAKRAVTEIVNRLQYLLDVGLSYLTLDRQASTLSGGESQRINLAKSLGSSLVGSLYILDEPSIGLHPRDTERLIGVLRQLRDLGNTVIVVEHEEEIIRAADQIIDIGPEAGVNGGEIVFQGTIDELEKSKKSLTTKYLSGEIAIETPAKPRKWNNFVEIHGARGNNLKGIDVKIPLGVITCVTGVSGSGKSSLIKGILQPAMYREICETGNRPGSFDSLSGDIHMIKGIEIIDQNPIGKSSRSNPVTYIKAYDEIRKLFSEQPHARHNGFDPSKFSFNIAGGRCEECKGEGVIHVEMQFMADVELQCEACKGRRFTDEILEVKYRGKNIYDILEMSVDDAVAFFGTEKNNTVKKLIDKLKTLQDVGLGYVKLGQSSSTLSGGESQRVKLASFLLKESSAEPLMFIFDEPTTGLHFHDIKKLMASFNALITKGHTIVIVEHNMDVIKCADWIIDLGPEGGAEGGHLVFEGTPSEIINCTESYTGRYLKEKLR